MSRTWCRRTSWFVVFVLVFFVAATTEVWGKKDGRGGGKNFSRGGAASRGSLKSNRSYGGGGREAIRQAGKSNREAMRQRGATTREAMRQTGASNRQRDRQDFKRENREDWQRHLNKSREDRQEYRDKVRDEWKEVADRREWGNNDWGEWNDRWEHPVATGLAVGAAMAIGSAITASAFNAMACPAPIFINSVYYYNCGGAWYSRAYQGNSVTYIVVNAPPGY